MEYEFRKATTFDAEKIWIILHDAILRRKKDGSDQWQDGYPNPEVVAQDIQKGIGHVLTSNNNIIGYSAVIFNDEPAYKGIEGRWLTNDDFIVVHRVAVSENHLGRGLAKKMFEFIEEIALANDIYSIKVDTNFDNIPMMKVFEKSGYTYCGEVYFRGSARRAYEKVLAREE
jgi:GNAT superfamily N-acetyltransferase